MPREIVQSLNVLAGSSTVIYGSAQAAAIYAGLSKPYPEVVFSLNVKAGNTLPNLREMAGVANQLAGTTGLEVQDALDRLATASLSGGAGNQPGGQTWASILGTWAQQTKTWANI